jgi:protein-L-isoaspartate(D-aspartate) O-methyltransferase
MTERESWRAEAREMVRTQIRARGVSDTAVLDAMERVPRHLFVPAGSRKEAYGDFPLPIGHGQTISQPYMAALMTELLQVRPGLKVLEIGTGSGYQAALLAALGARVVSVERIEALARSASKHLESSGFDVTVVSGDGRGGHVSQAPYDRVLVTAGALRVERAWMEELVRGGILVVPLTLEPGVERLLARRKRSGGYEDRWFDYCRFVPVLPGVVPLGDRRLRRGS